MGVGSQQRDFAEFHAAGADDCLRAVLVSVGDRDRAHDLVDEAFARAYASPGLVTVLLIHPAALPAGAGMRITASFTPVVSSGATRTQHGTVQRPTLVYASQACTGS